MAKLCLGTAGFGMKYGINNKTGKSTKKQVFKMFDLARREGIEYIDTAQAYGDAEEILGEYKHRKSFKIITKLLPNCFDDAAGKAINSAIMDMWIGSFIDRLRQDPAAMLLHTPRYIYDEKIRCALRKFRCLADVPIGVSIYNPEDALCAVKLGFDVIQVPYNIFDQRLDYTDFFQLAKEAGVQVFARSPFLQGLILMREDEIPDHLSLAKDYLREFDRIIRKHGFSRLEAAFLFSLTHTGLNHVVFGVDNIRQLKEDIQIAKRRYDFRACCWELTQAFRDVPESIVIPSLWAKETAS